MSKVTIDGGTGGISLGIDDCVMDVTDFKHFKPRRLGFSLQTKENYMEISLNLRQARALQEWLNQCLPYEGPPDGMRGFFASTHDRIELYMGKLGKRWSLLRQFW